MAMYGDRAGSSTFGDLGEDVADPEDEDENPEDGGVDLVGEGEDPELEDGDPEEEVRVPEDEGEDLVVISIS